MFRLRHWVPESAIAPVRELMFAAKATALRCVAWSPTASSLYYALLSPAFRREQRAVMAGMLRNLRYEDPKAVLFILRRNTHRLEKALLMRPRRELFALDYIDETLQAFLHTAERYPESCPELVWATDVLGEYFAVVGKSPIVDRNREAFERARPRGAACAPSSADIKARRIPYLRELGPSPVDYDALLQLARRRRSVRWFEQRTVPRELLDKALLVAQQAPSSCNRQPFCYRFIDAPEAVQRFAALPMGTTGFAQNIPVLCIVTGDLGAYFDERDRHGIYIDASLSIMGFMLALETLGLSSCPLNWPDVERRERRAARELNLQNHERIVMFMAIGYPDPEGLVAYSEKRPLEDVRTFEE